MSIPPRYEIRVLSAPSILGLKPGGVELLAEKLLSCGLAEEVFCTHPVSYVPTLNRLYNFERDPSTGCLNVDPLREFSIELLRAVGRMVEAGEFPLVLGGDCSVLIGILAALKSVTTPGLVFLDAHADFYSPETSLTGEVSDMELAIVTGRGPLELTDINGLCPYVEDEHVFHIGQRDLEETRRYKSPDIRKTGIQCYPLDNIEQFGIGSIINKILPAMHTAAVDHYWIHFDTDVLHDEVNPAVDYRLPGGLSPGQAEQLIKALLSTGKISGMSVTIFNPTLDPDGHIARLLTQMLGRAFAF